MLHATRAPRDTCSRVRPQIEKFRIGEYEHANATKDEKAVAAYVAEKYAELHSEAQANGKAADKIDFSGPLQEALGRMEKDP